MEEGDLGTVHLVWKDMVEKIKGGNYDNIAPFSADKISHIRPHGR